jgi:hypothetical protein
MLMIIGGIVAVILIIIGIAAATGAFGGSTNESSSSSANSDESSRTAPEGSAISNDASATADDTEGENEEVISAPPPNPEEDEEVPETTSAPATPSAPAAPAAPAAPTTYPTSGAVFAMKGLSMMPPLFQNSAEDRAVGGTKSASAGLRPAYLTNTSALGKQRNIRVHATGFNRQAGVFVDVARGQPARMSSQYDKNGAAGMAVDGNPKTFANSNDKTTSSWWEVDLYDGLSEISKITITNRPDKYGARTRDITITVQIGSSVVWTSSVLNKGGKDGNPPTLEVVVPPGTVGNRVRVSRAYDNSKDGYLNITEVVVLGRPVCTTTSPNMTCVIDRSFGKNQLGDLFDVNTGKSQLFVAQLSMFVATGIKWLSVLSTTADNKAERPKFLDRSNLLQTQWNAWNLNYNKPNTILFVPDHLLDSLVELNDYLASARSTVMANKKPSGGDADRLKAYFWDYYGDENDPVARIYAQTTFTEVSTAVTAASKATEEFARSILYENNFGCARRRPRLDYVREKGAKTAQPVQYVETAPGDRQLCVTPQTAPDMTDYEAMTYMTTYMDVEVLNLNDRAKNIAAAKTHWRTVGLPGGLIKNNFFFAKASNVTDKDSKKWIATDRTFTIPNVKPIGDVLKTSDMANTFLLTFYENMRDVLRVRLNTIYNWMRRSINVAGDVYNKKVMSTDEANTAKENFRKAMVLLYGTSVTIDKISTLPQILKDKKAPAIPEPIEINGIVANRVFLNGQWYAFSLNALAPYGYMDTRTSRMIFVCSSSNSAAVACRSSDDRICDFVTTGLPDDINKSACDPNTIYGAYMILYVFTKSLDAEYARQQDPYKKQKRNKTAKKDRCYHKNADGKNSKCTSDGYGMCDTYTKGSKKCKSGYYKKGTRCRAHFRSGACKGKSKISSSINDWIARLSAPITLAALEDDVALDEVDDGTPVEPDPSEAYVPGADEEGDETGEGAV